MEIETAQKVQKGDEVTYEGRPQLVEAVVSEGLWAPYFALPDVGLVSHRLVELPPVAAKAEKKPAKKA